MEYIIIVLISIIIISVLKQTFNIKISSLRKYKEDEALTKITDKFPESLELTKEILKNLDSETSLYIALTDTISISSKKNSCTRIQTIAHECLHSIQSRSTHIANFIVSNIYIIYFFLISILTIFKIIKNPLFYLIILTIMGFAQFAIRAYLEQDAMTKAKNLAKEYIEEKNIITKEELDKLCTEYDKINRMGIPFYIWNLFTNNMIKIIIYSIIALIITI